MTIDSTEQIRDYWVNGPGAEPGEWPEPEPAPEFDLAAYARANPDHTPLLPRDEPCTLTAMLATGATYRQIDHWTRRGWFTPPGGTRDDIQTPGSGKGRVWTNREWMICSLMIRLIRSGFVTVTAARISRDAVDSHVNRVSTEFGITIDWKGVL